MKKVLVLCLSFIVLASLASAQRLPEVASPESYKLVFTPDFTKDNFTGDENIQIRVLKSTSAIVLNSAEIEFQSATITSGSLAQQAKVTLDKENEQATLAVDKPIPPGTATIHIQYTGILNDQLRGFYLGKDEQGRKYAATQFEATDARRAFPSFDEPAYKATFDVTVVADAGMVAISNGKAISDSPGPSGKHTVHFATTPKMSSYLVAMVVGNFESIEGAADGIPIRVFTSPGKKELGTFALEAAENVMKYYNQYFGIKYPYGKLDMIALADFSAGAMENTACITYRESFLLLDNKHSGVDFKKQVASGIAHEMAHQWFGDLVTMQWWDDIWLNEGFATWMSSKPLEAWKPEWNVQLDDVNDLTGSLNADSLLNTHPIHQEAKTPAEILELADQITYGKTAAVLRMLEAYLGPETFRAGVNAYLKQHAYGNATSFDFWDAQTRTSHKPVDKIMPTFVQQPGPPFVSVSTQCSGNQQTVSVNQQRYFYDRSKMSAGTPELWQIPLCLKESSTDQKSAEHCELLTQKESTFTLPGCSPWTYTNAGARGYYHSNYSTDAVSQMARSAETALTPAERIMLLSDVWASVRIGREPIGDYLTLAEGLSSDSTSAVQDQLFSQLNYIGRILVSGADAATYQAWLRQLVAPLVKEVGWEPKPGESAEQSAVRARLLYLDGYTARDPEAIALAHKWADQVLQDPTSVSDEIAYGALQIAALDGDSALYDKVEARLKAAKSPTEFYAYQEAMASFKDPKLLERTLEFALSPDSRSQDSLLLIGRVMRNPDGQRVAWDFVRSHWSNIEKVGGAFGGGGGAIVASTGSFCDAGMRDEVRDFFASHSVPATERTLKQSLERINYCVDLKDQQKTQLAAWLQHQGGSAGK